MINTDSQKLLRAHVLALASPDKSPDTPDTPDKSPDTPDTPDTPDRAKVCGRRAGGC